MDARRRVMRPCSFAHAMGSWATFRALWPAFGACSTSRGGGAVMRFEPFFGRPFAVVLPQGTGGLGVQPTGLVVMPPPPSECRADFDGDGQPTLIDFIEFQNAFALGCP